MLKLRLSHKVMSIGAVGAIGLMLVGGIYLAGTARQELQRGAADTAREVHQRVARIQIELLEVRRAEKDFLLRKDESYIKRHGEFARKAGEDLAALQRWTRDTGDLEQKRLAILQRFEAYAAHFAALSKARIKLGLDENSGLEGALRASVHDIEAALKDVEDPRLMVTMLMMRRHEKDFMLRGEAKSGEDMKKRAAEFTAQLAAPAVAPAARTEMTEKLAAYQRDFFAWMGIAQEVAREQKAVSETFAAIEPLTDAITKTVDTARIEAEAAEAAARDSTGLQLRIAMIVIFAGVVGLAFLIGRGISVPIRAMARVLGELAGGNKAIEVPYTDRGDEIGDNARAAQTFKENLLRIERMETEQKAAAARAGAQRKLDMNKLADEFEAAVGEIVQIVSSASAELEASATTLTRTAETTQQRSAVVASASEEASVSVSSVATATEELVASVTEIGRQVQQSSRIAGEAVDQARNTDNRITKLAQAASRIGDVTQLITSIAEQTNLLALNATIEAARAGEAGKGFAVVAQEVKQLAAQTAKATSEISTQIAEMQAATQDSVTAIKEIGGTIGRISEIATTIASAVEEQGAATQEITRNIQQAAAGTVQVANNISEVSEGAAKTGTASTAVLTSAKSLADQSGRLKTEVNKFLATVRAA